MSRICDPDPSTPKCFSGSFPDLLLGKENRWATNESLLGDCEGNSPPLDVCAPRLLCAVCVRGGCKSPPRKATLPVRKIFSSYTSALAASKKSAAGMTGATLGSGGHPVPVTISPSWKKPAEQGLIVSHASAQVQRQGFGAEMIPCVRSEGNNLFCNA